VTRQQLGEHRLALASLEAAAREAARRYGEAHPATLEVRGVRATGLLYGGDPGAAALELDAVIAGRAALGLGAGDPTTATLHGYRCEAAIDAAAADAMARCQTALAIAEAVYGPADPQLAWPLRLVGQLQVEAGERGPARATLERALALAGASLDPRDPAVIRAYLALALQHRDPRRAHALARTALAELPDDDRARPLRAQLAALRP
jgi:tetratricopeptide (TPR) repeat protein